MSTSAKNPSPGKHLLHSDSDFDLCIPADMPWHRRRCFIELSRVSSPCARQLSRHVPWRYLSQGKQNLLYATPYTAVLSAYEMGSSRHCWIYVVDNGRAMIFCILLVDCFIPSFLGTGFVGEAVRRALAGVAWGRIG
jgi:hypothetical protein